MKFTSVIFYTNLNLFRIALSVFTLLAFLSASADTITWTGTSYGVQTTSTIENWSLVDDTNPSTPNTLWSTSVPYLYPTNGHAMMVKVSSDFLFTDSGHGAHLVLGLNHVPVYTYGPTGYWPNNPRYIEYTPVYTEGYWGVGGNQAMAYVLGNFSPCNRQGAFEAIYQLPKYDWGVTGGNGLTQNEISPCISIPSFNSNAEGEREVVILLYANYDGTMAATYFPPNGYPGFGNSIYNWQNWFVERAGAVPQNGGAAIGVVGDIPVGKHIRVQVQNLSPH